MTLYADDTVLFCSAKSAIELEPKLNSDLRNLSHWFAANRLTLNTSKCKFMVFASNAKLTRLNNVSLLIDNCPLSRTESFKYLGITLSPTLSWSDHVEAISNKIYQRLGAIRRVKHLITLESRLTFVNSLVMAIFDYADRFVWGDKNNSVLMDHLQVLHNKADAHPLSPALESLQLLNWQPLSTRRHFHRCLMMYKCLNNIVNFQYLSDIHSYNTRNKQNLHLDHVKRNWGKQAFTCHATNDWNSLLVELRQIELFTSFKIKLKKHLTP